MWAFMEYYDDGKFKQPRLVIWVINQDILNHYIITSKEWKLFTADYSYHLYQQFIFGSLEFKPLELIPSVNPDGLGSFLILKMRNTHLPDLEVDGSTTCACFRLNVDCPRPEIELSNFINTSLPYNVKVLTLVDNIVIQHRAGLIIYNLTKQKDLIISAQSEDPLRELIDVYIDQK